MNFQKYNEVSSKTIQADFPLFYLVLGLNEESGEVSGALKKSIRDNGGILDEQRKNCMLKECGDVLWYLNQVCNKLGSSLEDVAKMNIKKLQNRKKRGTLGGSGNNR